LIESPLDFLHRLIVFREFFNQRPILRLSKLGHHTMRVSTLRVEAAVIMQNAMMDGSPTILSAGQELLKVTLQELLHTLSSTSRLTQQPTSSSPETIVYPLN
jgi:hypothetical protein